MCVSMWVKGNEGLISLESRAVANRLCHVSLSLIQNHYDVAQICLLGFFVKNLKDYPLG